MTAEMMMMTASKKLSHTGLLPNNASKISFTMITSPRTCTIHTGVEIMSISIIKMPEAMASHQ